MTSARERLTLRGLGSTPLDLSQAQQLIAAEVRAELARQQVPDEFIAAQLGANQQWFNRRKNGHVAFSGAELAAVARLLDVDVAQFYGRVTIEPSDPEGQWAPSGSNRRPTDYKSAPCQVLDFPPARPALAPIIQLPRRQLARAS